MMKKTLIGLALVVALAVTGGMVYAHGGGGWNGGWGGGHMMGWGGQGGYHMGWGGQGGYGAYDQEFYNQTAELRNRLYQKNAELNQLLSAPEVDEGKVKAVQVEINKLQGELSEKRLEAELQWRKQNPNAQNGAGYGPRGWGGGPGACWR